MILLRAAFSRLSERVREDVVRYNPFWLEDYALFMAIKEQYDLSPWYDWPDEALKRCAPQALERARREHRSMIMFYRFVQWAFEAQWKEFKAYANGKGVKLVGDIPFYVSEDSAEVWSRREMFATGDDGEFLAVAGAPPDYFNPDGQLWGNPLYDWEYMDKEGYTWWTGRVQSALEHNDFVRLDHFRGFESFWSIPAGSKSAKAGAWVKGPGIKPFQAMKKALGEIAVIAEDLGFIGPEVEALLADTGFPGMGVLQFAFLGDDRHLPHRYGENHVAYTGTHDNTTLLAWMYEMQPEDRAKALFYCGYEGDWGRGGPNCGICRAWIRVLYMSKAYMVVVPIQDLLGYGADTRTNVPGSPEGNWRFRVTQESLDQIDVGYYKRLSAITDRA
jgi:4-alpha-glucanotransferase